MINSSEKISNCLSKILQEDFKIKNIFEQIKNAGGQLLLVGGSVRDCLLNIKSADLDFEVYHLSFEKLEQILNKFGHVSLVGKSFGVLRVHGIDADWSVPRLDSVGRKPIVQLDPNLSFDQSFARRDLTINAMGIDFSTKKLIDPFGGFIDLQNKILRSPNLDFFVQDPLRLFRVMQFAARFEFSVDPMLTKVCKKIDISQVSHERICAEFYKLMIKSRRPSIGLQWLQKIDQFSLKYSFLSLDCFSLNTNEQSEKKLIGLWSLFAQNFLELDNQKIDVMQKISMKEVTLLQKILQKYICSLDIAYQAALISLYLPYILMIVTQKNIKAIKWLAHWLEPVCTLNLLSELAACQFSDQRAFDFKALAQEANVLFMAEKPLIVGQDLLLMAEGKELGIFIKKAYELQINENITNKNDLMKKLFLECKTTVKG